MYAEEIYEILQIDINELTLAIHSENALWYLKRLFLVYEKLKNYICVSKIPAIYLFLMQDQNWLFSYSI